MIDISTALIRDALKNAWANPAQDRQFLIKPKQVTSARGTLGAYRAPYSVYPVPDTTHRWMLYEYGQLAPRTIGLDLNNSDWRSLKEVMEQEDLIAFPMIMHRVLLAATVMVIRLKNNNLLFAVEMASNKSMLDWDSDLYIRFYSNSLFSTDEGASYGGVRSDGALSITGSEPAALLSAYNAAGYSNSGTTWWFKNGYLTDKPTVNDIAIGDSLQFIWDSAGTQYFDVPMKNLTAFTSIKDQIAKLLLVTPSYIDDDFIFYDDIEIFIYSEDLDGKKKGCYYDRQRVSDLSQITHRDWGLDSSRLADVILEQNGEVNFSSAIIRVYLRKTVAISTNIGDGDYLGDFYNVDVSGRYRILTGSYGNLTKWKAAELENSAFMKWLGAAGTSLTEDDIRQVYNYYGLQRAVQMPVKGVGNWLLPEMAKNGCLVINLDAEGKYLSNHIYTESTFGSGLHVPTDGTADILVYCGEAVNSALPLESPIVGETDYTSDFDEERFYYQTSLQEWVIATQGVDYFYNESEDIVEWSAIRAASSKVKRTSRYFAFRELEIPFTDLCEPIPIFTQPGETITGFDFGRVDLWIDGHRAALGLDYTILNQQVYITSKEYIDLVTDPQTNPQVASITFVAHGLPKDTEGGQYGFVVEGMVNHDDNIDLVRNRNQSLFIDGKLTDVKNVWLAEDFRGEYSVRFSTDAFVTWREGTAYAEHTPVFYDRVLYVAPIGGVIATQVFEENLWHRVWDTSIFSYDDNGSTRHVKIYAGEDTVLVRSLALDGVMEPDYTFIDLVLDVDYTLAYGLPLPNKPENASTYFFSDTPSVISRFVAQTYAESEADARLFTKSISGYLEALSPSYELTGPINIPRQHKVVSPFMWAVTKALQVGEINPTAVDLSEAAIDFMTRDYQSLLSFDPAADGTLNHEFITCYGHSDLSAIALNSRAVSFLSKCNEYFFENRIQINRDYTIAQ